MRKTTIQPAQSPISTYLSTASLNEAIAIHSSTTVATAPKMNGGGSAPPSRRPSLIMPSPVPSNFPAITVPQGSVVTSVDSSKYPMALDPQYHYLINQQYPTEQLSGINYQHDTRLNQQQPLASQISAIQHGHVAGRNIFILPNNNGHVDQSMMAKPNGQPVGSHDAGIYEKRRSFQQYPQHSQYGMNTLPPSIKPPVSRLGNTAKPPQSLQSPQIQLQPPQMQPQQMQPSQMQPPQMQPQQMQPPQMQPLQMQPLQMQPQQMQPPQMQPPQMQPQQMQPPQMQPQQMQPSQMQPPQMQPPPSLPAEFLYSASSMSVSSHRGPITVPTSPVQSRPSVVVPRRTPGLNTPPALASPSPLLPVSLSPLVPSPESQAIIEKAEPSIQKILRANNNRLADLGRHLADAMLYGPACDELNTWCKDERAYNHANIEMIHNCMKRLRKFAPKYGLWSGVKVFKVVTGFKERFAPQARELLVTWQKELEEEMKRSGNANTQVQIEKKIDGEQLQSGTNRSQSIFPATTPGASMAATSSLPSPSNSPNLNLYGNTASVFLSDPAGTNVTQPGVSDTGLAKDSLPQQRHSQSSAHQFIFPGGTLSQNTMNSIVQSSVAKQLSQMQHNRNQIRLPTPQAAPILMPQLKEPTYTSLSPNYTRLHSYLLRPFKLTHQKQSTLFSFDISKERYDRIWRKKNPIQIRAETREEELPLTIQLNAWRPSKDPKHDIEEEGKTEWPSEGVHIHLNNRVVQLNRKTKQPVPNRPEGTFVVVGKDRPVDLELYLKPGQNYIKFIQDACGCGLNYCVQLLVRESEEYIVKLVRERSVALEDGIKLINRLLGNNSKLPEPSSLNRSKPVSTTPDGSVTLPPRPQGDDDDIEIFQKSVRVSLRDPIGMLRISEPVKGIDCRHVDCFDLVTFLVTNRDNAHWKCPYCNKRLTSSNLYRDLFFEDLLTKVPRKIRTVELVKDGAWTPVNVDPDSSSDNEDEDKDVQSGNKSDKKDAEGDISMRDAGVVTKHVEIVSLLSDDEEAEPYQARTKRGRTTIESDSNLNDSSGDNRESANMRKVRRDTLNNDTTSKSLLGTTTFRARSSGAKHVSTPFPVGGIQMRKILPRKEVPIVAQQTQYTPVLNPVPTPFQTSGNLPTEPQREMSNRPVTSSAEQIQKASELMLQSEVSRNTDMTQNSQPLMMNSDTRTPIQEPTPPSSSTKVAPDYQHAQTGKNDSSVAAVTLVEKEDSVEIEEIEEMEEIVAVGNVANTSSSSNLSTSEIIMVGNMRLNVPK